MIKTANGAFTYAEFGGVILFIVLISYGYLWLFHGRWFDGGTE